MNNIFLLLKNMCVVFSPDNPTKLKPNQIEDISSIFRKASKGNKLNKTTLNMMQVDHNDA